MLSDYDTDVSACCAILEGGGECDYSLVGFQKDVYDPHYYNGPAISETLLAIITFGVIIYALKNLKDIYDVRKRMSVKNSFIMNLLVFLALLCKLLPHSS